MISVSFFLRKFVSPKGQQIVAKLYDTNYPLAKTYLERIFKNELHEVMDTSTEMEEWCDLFELQLRYIVRQMEGTEKDTVYRLFLKRLLTELKVKDLLPLLNKQSSVTDEMLSLKDAAEMLNKNC